MGENRVRIGGPIFNLHHGLQLVEQYVVLGFGGLEIFFRIFRFKLKLKQIKPYLLFHGQTKTNQIDLVFHDQN